MGLTQTRPEKQSEMTNLVHAIREAAISPARRGELNIAEVVSAFGQAFASILVGAYHDKEREIVVSTFPDLVRSYYPVWEQIYAKHNAAPSREKN